MAPIPAMAAAVHSGDGAPSPITQAGSGGTPTAAAADRMRWRPSLDWAVQASNRAPALSDTSRSVKGAITGRGDEICSDTGRSAGMALASAVSSWRRCCAVSAIAVTSTWLPITEIFERGNCASAVRP